jgi:hypothetical protein
MCVVYHIDSIELMTDVKVKYDRFFCRSVMGALLVRRWACGIWVRVLFRFEYRGCQVGRGVGGGAGWGLRCCKYGAKWGLKKVENRLHSIDF